jgi:membrane-bound serine protease (ClpP class)
MRRLSVLTCVLLLSFVPPASAERDVLVVYLDGMINPVAAKLLEQQIEAAEQTGAVCLIVVLDTPGGLMDSMREMVKDILASRVPIAMYVAPSGARAASAGVFLVTAAHVAAMSPGTNIGAAHPVQLMGGKLDKHMAQKLENDTVAYLKSLAAQRGRNTEWAEKAVRESESITAGEALQLGVVDLVVEDVPSLLSAMDGRTVNTAGKEVTLETRGAALQEVRKGLRERLLDLLSNPNVAYLLLILGFYGIYFELQSPGIGLPGIVGALCLILAFYSMQVLPVNWAGVLLLGLGMLLLFLETRLPGHGLLAVGGIVSMLLGSLMLFNSGAPILRVSYLVIAGVLVATVLFFLVALTLVVKAQRRRPVSGIEGMVGLEGVAKTPLSPKGKIFVHGEYWDAVARVPVEEGGRVRVVQADGLVLKVAPVDDEEGARA